MTKKINKIGKVILLLSILLTLVSCNNSSEDYISISCTTYNEENTELMTTSIYKYLIKDGKTEEIFNFPYTTQYPLGVFSQADNSVYFSKRDASNHDQIFVHDLSSNKEYQLTNTLRAVNQIIPTKESIFFVASSTDKVLRLGSIDKKTMQIRYWGDEDINVETIDLNPVTQKIYISGFSSSKDKENIAKQFISDENVYSMPLFVIYETDYGFNETTVLFAKHSWIRLLLMNISNDSLLAIYDKEYNSPEPSESIVINLKTKDIQNFELPKERLQVDGGGFSPNGKKIYGIFAPNDQRGIYSYDLDDSTYNEIFTSKDGFINNFQIIHKD